MTYEAISELIVDSVCLAEEPDEKNLYQPAVYYQRDDRLWKGLLEDLLEDFLRFFFPESFELFDPDRGVAYLDKEFDQFLSSEDSDAGRCLIS